MTAVTTGPREAAGGFAAPRGLLRAMLRLHRSALCFWLMLVVVTAGTLLWAIGPGVDAAWAEYRSMGCDQPRPGPYCPSPGAANDRLLTAVAVAKGLLALLPMLTAAWAGGALMGRELESGTAQLAWTQTVSPARWLAAKLSVPALSLLAGTLVLTLLHRLFWSSNDSPIRRMGWFGWHDPRTYEINGTVATAHVLAALALGVLAGLLLRRTLPALGAAVLATASLVYVLDDLRPSLGPTPKTVTAADGPPSPAAMLVEQGGLTADGTRVPVPNCMGEPGCEAKTGITGYYTDYHPSSHFWPLQLTETGIALAVAALAVAASFWLLRRRTGAAV